MKLPEPFERDGYKVEFEYGIGPDTTDQKVIRQIINYKITAPDNKKYGRGISLDLGIEPDLTILYDSIDQTIDMLKKRASAV